MRLRTVLVLAPLLMACSGEAAQPAQASSEGATSTSGGGGAGGGYACKDGQVPKDGACVDVGLTGCVDRFVDPDGVCRPAMKKCDPGTTPIFTKGCVAVGVPSCASAFVADQGVCAPKSASCAAGSFADPKRGCVSLDGDTGCGTATWPASTAGSTTVYVDATSGDDAGDGSQQHPRKTITAALSIASSGAVVALAAGRYTEAVRVESPVAIVGRCASMVTLDGSDLDPIAPSTIYVTADGARLSGVTIGGAGAGVIADGAAALALDHVAVTGALGVGVHATASADVTITSSLVSAIVASATSPKEGLGVLADGGATISISQSAVLDATGDAVRALGAGTKVTLEDVLIEDTQGLPGFFNEGNGVYADDAATVEAHAVAFVDNRWNGVSLDGAAHATVADSSFYGELRPGNLGTYAALFAEGGSVATLSGIVVVHHHAPVQLDSSTLHLEESLVCDNAMEIYSGDLDVTDTTFFDSAFTAINVPASVATTVSLAGVLIEHPRPSLGVFGSGVLVNGPTTLDIHDSHIAEANVAGVFLSLGAKATISRTSIDTVAKGKFLVGIDAKVETSGDGVVTTSGAEAKLDAMRIDACERAGVLFDSASGDLTASLSTGNAYGVVLDGSPTPTLDASSQLVLNSVQDELDDANLVVPPAMPAAPQ
ncbi:MAG TPA: right-handed parallel beta-helix repeat-containing protein [Byssovorax sp.]|jgi:hypothetical protein